MALITLNPKGEGQMKQEYKLTKQGEEIIKFCEKVAPMVNEEIEKDSRLRELAELDSMLKKTIKEKGAKMP